MTVMSDNIKKSYVSYMDGEKPSEEFLSSLAVKLKAEEKRVRARKRTALIIRSVSAAAACLVVCIAVPLALKHMQPTVPVIDEQPHNPAGTINSSVLDTRPLESADSTAELNSAVLAGRLESSLSELSVSDSNRFVGAPTVEGEELSALIAQLYAAKETSAAPEGALKWYMAVFDDNTVVKFTVSENGIIEIKGTEKFFG
ncbi:MAG: hypothetical protein ACI4J8_10690 [Oscillospiraceae bacterium]